MHNSASTVMHKLEIASWDCYRVEIEVGQTLLKVVKEFLNLRAFLTNAQCNREIAANLGMAFQYEKKTNGEVGILVYNSVIQIKWFILFCTCKI